MDEVSEVIDIDEDTIEETFRFGNLVNLDFIMSIAKFAQKVIMLQI